MNKLKFYIVYALLALSAVFINEHQDVQVPVARALEEIPSQLHGWSQVDEMFFSSAVLKGLRPTDYVYRVYRDADNHQVSFYLGYHGGGPDSGPIHSPRHCLPGSGWSLLSEQDRTLLIGTEEVRLVEAVYQNGEHKEVFLYWYQVRGETLTSEYMLKFAEIMNSVRYNRRDSAFVRISTRYQGSKNAHLSVAEQFVRDFYPEIKAVLPR